MDFFSEAQRDFRSESVLQDLLGGRIYSNKDHKMVDMTGVVDDKFIDGCWNYK